MVVTWNHFTDNVNTVKKNVHQILVDRQLWPIGESRVVEDCVFKTAADNFLLDEFVLLYLCEKKEVVMRRGGLFFISFDFDFF